MFPYVCDHRGIHLAASKRILQRGGPSLPHSHTTPRPGLPGSVAPGLCVQSWAERGRFVPPCVVPSPVFLRAGQGKHCVGPGEGVCFLRVCETGAFEATDGKRTRKWSPPSSKCVCVSIVHHHTLIHCDVFSLQKWDVMHAVCAHDC